jgi:hypothetical protein
MNTANSMSPVSMAHRTSVTAYDSVPGCRHPSAGLRA